MCIYRFVRRFLGKLWSRNGTPEYILSKNTIETYYFLYRNSSVDLLSRFAVGI